jgi:hypothetical protein
MKNGVLLSQQVIYDSPLVTRSVDVVDNVMILTTYGVSAYPGKDEEDIPSRVSIAPLTSPSSLTTIASGDPSEFSGLCSCVLHEPKLIVVAYPHGDGWIKVFNIDGTYLYDIPYAKNCVLARLTDARITNINAFRA